MAQLNAPQLLNILPPSYCDTNNVSHIHLKGKASPAVGPDDFTAYHLLIKTIGGDYVAEFQITKEEMHIDKKTSTFDVIIENSDLQLNVGDFYKLQLAYEVTQTSSYSIGYYSNVSTMKYTSEPKVGIIPNNNSSFSYKFTCQYINVDLSEKLVSVRAEVHQDFGSEPTQLLYKIDEHFHSTEQDELYEQKLKAEEVIEIPYALTIDNNKYKINFYFKTINGLEICKPFYINSSDISVSSIQNINFELLAIPDIGGMLLQITNHSLENESQTYASGTYKLWKKRKMQNFWGLIATIDFTNTQKSLTKKIIDYGFEQNELYQYMLQKIDNGVISESSIYPIATPSTPVSNNRLATAHNYQQDETNNISQEGYCQLDFEDIFLYDGKRQLKIKFDPKVSSIKQNYQESKFESLGSSFPQFARGGKVNYKEMSLAGLISYHMDDMLTFLTPQELVELGLDDECNNNTQLTANNIYAERKFKFKILDWLNNGQPKLLRSPIEGNSIVYIMNASLSPNDTLGRMIHSFSCTMYEYDELSILTLEKYHFLQGLELINNDNLIPYGQSIVPVPKNILNLSVVEDTVINQPYQYDQINLTSPVLNNYLAGSTTRLTNLKALNVPCAYNSVLIEVAGTLTSLPNRAFDHCTNLQMGSFPEITILPSYAFYWCQQLTTLNCPSVTTIGPYALYGCTKLESINLLKQVTNIQNYGLANIASSSLAPIRHFELINVHTLGGYACQYNYYALSLSAPELNEMTGSLVFANFGNYLSNSIKAAILLSNANTFSQDCFKYANIDTLVLVSPAIDCQNNTLKDEVIIKINNASLPTSGLTLYVPSAYITNYKNANLPWGTDNVQAIENNIAFLQGKGLVIPESFIPQS